MWYTPTKKNIIIKTPTLFNGILIHPLKDAELVYMVYSINNIESFEAIQNLYDKLVSRNVKRGAIILLIGNKKDLRDSQSNNANFVSTDDGKQLAIKNGWFFTENSFLDIENLLKTSKIALVSFLMKNRKEGINSRKKSKNDTSIVFL